MKYVRPLIFVISCLLISQHTFAKVYKWTDEKGLTHFSEHPPANQANEVIKPKTGHSDPVNYSTAATSAPADTAKQAGKEETPAHVKDPERCASAQKNQTTLQTSARVKVKGDNGEYRYLSPDELQQKMSEANKAIEESCD